MGSIPATTKIRNIRENLGEQIADADLTDPTKGTQWSNTTLLAHLNKGQPRCADLIRSVREDYFEITSAALSFLANTKEYDLAARFMQLVGIKVTTSGYEYITFRKVGQGDSEFIDRDSRPVGQTLNLSEFVYDVVGQSKFKLADFPPVALAVSYDYIEDLADYTLSVSSTSSIPDKCAEYEEAYATRLALAKTPDDKRIPFWDKEILRLESVVKKAVKNRDIKESDYVEPFYPC